MGVILMNKKGAVPFVAFLMLLGFVVSLIAISNQYDLGLAEIFGYDLVYKANWGHICCEKVGAYDYTYYKWLDQQTTFSCTGIYTDECNILVEEESIKFGHISGYYTITGLTQQPYVGNQEFTILAGKSVTFSAGLFTADNTKVTCLRNSELKTQLCEVNIFPFSSPTNLNVFALKVTLVLSAVNNPALKVTDFPARIVNS